MANTRGNTTIYVYSIEESFVFTKPRTSGISLAHLNIRGIRSSLDEIEILLGKRILDILTLSDTWLNEGIDYEEFTIEGYPLLRRDRGYANGGGVAAYIKNVYAFKERPDLQSNDLDVLWFELNIPKSKAIFIASAYRLPTDETFHNKFETQLLNTVLQNPQKSALIMYTYELK